MAAVIGSSSGEITGQHGEDGGEVSEESALLANKKLGQGTRSVFVDRNGRKSFRRFAYVWTTTAALIFAALAVVYILWEKVEKSTSGSKPDDSFIVSNFYSIRDGDIASE
jgi:hypothetical protein